MGTRVGLDLRHLGVPLQGGVVVDPPLLVQHPAVPVIGRLVQAHVGHDEQVVPDLGPHVPDGDLKDPVRVGPGRAERVLLGLLRHAEEHDPGDPGLYGLQRGLLQAVARVLHDTGHGLDRHRLAHTLPHERGQDEVGRMQPGLRDHAPHDGGGTQPPGTRTGKGSVLRHGLYATPGPGAPLPTPRRPEGAPPPRPCAPCTPRVHPGMKDPDGHSCARGGRDDRHAPPHPGPLRPLRRARPGAASRGRGLRRRGGSLQPGGPTRPGRRRGRDRRRRRRVGDALGRGHRHARRRPGHRTRRELPPGRRPVDQHRPDDRRVDRRRGANRDRRRRA